MILVLLGELPYLVAIQIEHSPDPPILTDAGEDDFALVESITGDVSVPKLSNIVDHEQPPRDKALSAGPMEPNRATCCFVAPRPEDEAPVVRLTELVNVEADPRDSSPREALPKHIDES